ncbi:MAG: DNA polymerase/3'-5' exonuclease PolX [Actinobacteria bacterium]|nr:DNA polymerase/3'-5' exonuclease PolX [Actinomycetota bacterium]
MPKTNEEIEELFNEWAELIGITGGDPFRVRSYEKAARAVGGYSKDLRDLTDKDILAIPNVGKGMAGRIREYLETGTMHELEDLRELSPPGLRELLRIPGLGPKKALTLYETLGIHTVAELADALEEHKLKGIKGFGAKTEDNLLHGLRNLSEQGQRIQIDVALDTAEDIIRTLRDQAPLIDIVYAGSLRRMRDTIGDLDLLVASDDAAKVMSVFCEMPRTRSIIAHGETKSSIVTRKGIQVDLRVLPLDAWGAGLIYFTGSKAHNVKIRQIAIKKGFKLSEWGLFEAATGKTIAARTEEDVYEALGLPWIPPTLREDAGEVEAALKDELPALVQEKDIRGDLHTHTNLTDGLAPLEEMVATAAARGLEYYAVTDHAENLFMTGMSREKVIEQRAKIAKLQKKYPKMKLLHGCELNIGKDGSLDYDPQFLLTFDVTVASVHSYFRLSRDETTARVIKAMESPAVTVIGHPSGRMIGRRQPIDFDFEAVCAAAVRTGTALEVNCFPDRMDLRDEHVRWAIERGVTISIDTDSHAPKHLGNVRFGVGTAQRGWATKKDVLTTRTLKQMLAFAHRKRG